MTIKRNISTVKELIAELEKYPQDTIVSGGVIDGNCESTFDLVLKEICPIGGRDTEEQLCLLIGYEEVS